MEKYGFVYIWYDKKKKLYYIGSHWGTENDGYICSSPWMSRAYNNRPHDFKRRILKKVYTSRKDLFEIEAYFLSKIKPEEVKSKYYNLNISNPNHWTADPLYYKSVIEKISQKTKEAMYRPDVREKYLDGIQNRDNRSSDIEVREKRRQTMKKTMAEKFTIEDRKKRLQKDDPKLLEVYKQKSEEMWANRSEEEKKDIGRKISEANKGKKQRLGQKNSEEHRNKIKEALLNIPKSICKYCEKEYSSIFIEKHENACKSNPTNFKICSVCGNKGYFRGMSCSYTCARIKTYHMNK